MYLHDLLGIPLHETQEPRDHAEAFLKALDRRAKKLPRRERFAAKSRWHSMFSQDPDLVRAREQLSAVRSFHRRRMLDQR